MLDELVSELLDLSATEKGYGRALYAVNEEGGGGCSSIGCCSVVLCCSVHICW